MWQGLWSWVNKDKGKRSKVQGLRHMLYFKAQAQIDIEVELENTTKVKFLYFLAPTQ